MRMRTKLVAAAAAAAIGVVGAVAVAQPAFAADCPATKTFYVGSDTTFPYAGYVMQNGQLVSYTTTTCRYYGPVYAYSLGNSSYVGYRYANTPR